MERQLKKKEIEVDGRKFTVRELLAIELDDVDFGNLPEARMKQVTLSTGLTEEEYRNLTFKERLVILKTYNQINGVEDFLKNSQ